MIKKFLPAIIAVSLFIIFLLIPAPFIKKYIPLHTVTGEGVNLNETTFKGSEIQTEMFNDDKFYPIFGSSELEKRDPFHPAHIFKEKKIGKIPFLIGTGGSTNLIHAINIGSHSGHIEKKKIAIIISPQWFTQSGLDDNNFSARYSELQLDRLLSSPDVSHALKSRISQRLMNFSATKEDAQVQLYADGKEDESEVSSSFTGGIYENLMEKNDIVKSKFMIPGNRFKKRQHVDLQHKSWDEIRQSAVKFGRRKATNNPYYMRNEYYDKIQKHQKKIYRHGEFYENSQEFDDLQLLLDILKESKADPLFISIPANGKWYDHINIPAAQRKPVYDKINKQITASGFKLYDLTDKEYEPYVLSDAVHIGWKGWAYIDEQMDNHIHNRPITNP
ncbi:D-alanyl-lipoteichoic acid biosynthesis protein DltD [Macrococcoides canis]|uniref:D-alanyl-lipoteichoic acid biosynthesis protein DltD n=1 Tax=Macrococcoides canis TaxID=1855823 RepID=UPI001F3A60B1|nr:D-alanyl-lipoteichoic acid biosynthesis protein DltD [Macrococcus canis]UJS28516.1 D-alanyl-lipoteichoic acid biosynthesis protein DltD [Macrococcus canis]UTH00760.1 D-alanyl-lipoteichoic acid biosynthesis protein DltD [Macrococcus canis]UTH12242.1 D-alanyl-lipoteichoic acid biosynthesis protein DltD [Macrococcus canis]WBF52243.1 D-alanyl-lipoteichoic acid biosynthesis protein DltD [Macrococcus canis]